MFSTFTKRFLFVILSVCSILVFLFLYSNIDQQKNELGQNQTTLLNEALYRYKNIDSTLFTIPIPLAADTFTFGDTSLIIKNVKERLIQFRDLSTDNAQNLTLFDSALSVSLISFQQRHGIEESGKIDHKTISEMNIDLKNRIETIQQNILRWKKTSDDTCQIKLVVNIADFSLSLYDDNLLIKKMKVIVGKTYRKTPVLSSIITHIVINPDWVVPSTIFNEDLLPLIIKDPEYVDKNGYYVIKVSSNGARTIINKDTINWNNFNADDFKNIYLVQPPGPENPLGKFKFIFHNNYTVYLHDTPYKHLFEQENPLLSSGCIRLSDAKWLTEYLLGKEGWDRIKIYQYESSGKTTYISLKNPVSVQIQYFTCWVDEGGKVQFRKDVYKKDLSSPILTNTLRKLT